MKAEILEYTKIEKFLVDLKKEFGKGDNKTTTVAKLKKVKQRSKTIEKFVHKFRRIARGSYYKERLLVEEFQRGTNSIIRRELIKVKRSLRSIEQ